MTETVDNLLYFHLNLTDILNELIIRQELIEIQAIIALKSLSSLLFFYGMNDNKNLFKYFIYKTIKDKEYHLNYIYNINNININNNDNILYLKNNYTPPIEINFHVIKGSMLTYLWNPYARHDDHYKALIKIYEKYKDEENNKEVIENNNEIYNKIFSLSDKIYKEYDFFEVNGIDVINSKLSNGKFSWIVIEILSNYVGTNIGPVAFSRLLSRLLFSLPLLISQYTNKSLIKINLNDKDKDLIEKEKVKDKEKYIIEKGKEKEVVEQIKENENEKNSIENENEKDMENDKVKENIDVIVNLNQLKYCYPMPLTFMFNYLGTILTSPLVIRVSSHENLKVIIINSMCTTIFLFLYNFFFYRNCFQNLNLYLIIVIC